MQGTQKAHVSDVGTLQNDDHGFARHVLPRRLVELTGDPIFSPIGGYLANPLERCPPSSQAQPHTCRKTRPSLSFICSPCSEAKGRAARIGRAHGVWCRWYTWGCFTRTMVLVFH